MKHLLLGTGWMLLAAIPVAWGARNERAAGDQAAVRLRDAVEVAGSRVWLADLLPSDAPLRLQRAAAAIELCPAPQPGSARVLDAGQVRSKLAGQPGMLGQVTIPSLMIVRYSGQPIAQAAVRVAISEFLREQGWKRDLPDAARLEWLQPLAATVEHPRLQVMGLEWDNRQQSLEVRLRCATRAFCGSFLVHVVLPPPMDEEWRDRLRSGGALHSARSGQPAEGVAQGPVLAEKGKPATLILDGGSVRISLRVICLQGGTLNQEIRVLDRQNRRVLHAEVVGAGLLRASW